MLTPPKRNPSYLFSFKYSSYVESARLMQLSEVWRIALSQSKVFHIKFKNLTFIRILLLHLIWKFCSLSAALDWQVCLKLLNLLVTTICAILIISPIAFLLYQIHSRLPTLQSITIFTILKAMLIDILFMNLVIYWPLYP